LAIYIIVVADFSNEIFM